MSALKRSIYLGVYRNKIQSDFYYFHFLHV